MARSLLGLPVRIGLRATGMALSLAVGVAEEALGVAGRVAEALIRRSEPGPDFAVSPAGEAAERPASARTPAPDRKPTPPRRAPRQPTPRSSRTRPAPAARPARRRPAEPPVPSPPPSTPPAVPPAPSPPLTEPVAPELQEPRHVSEEPTVVASSAEPGAEESPGPAIHVEEPWPGYRQMRAPDVIDRLKVASTAELAAVRLYEQSGRGRRSILATVERELARR